MKVFENIKRRLAVCLAVAVSVTFLLPGNAFDGKAVLTSSAANPTRLPVGGKLKAPDLPEVKGIEAGELKGVSKNITVVPAVETGTYYNYLTSFEKSLYKGMYVAADSQNRYESANYPFPEVSEEIICSQGYHFYDGTENPNSLITGEAENRAIEALCYDHMNKIEYYMCVPHIAYTISGNTYSYYILMQPINITSANIDSYDSAIQNKVNEYKDAIKSAGLIDDEYDAITILNVYDWYMDKVSYDLALEYAGNAGYYDVAHTAYGSLCEGEAVCDGYSQGYALILKSLELKADCLVVTGNAITSEGSGGHAWNMVKLDGFWYEEDTTWGDGITGTNHLFFNCTTAQYASGIDGDYHIRQTPYTGELLPKAVGTHYTYDYLISGNVQPDTKIAVEGVSIDDISTIEGESVTLNPYVFPSNAGNKNVFYEIDDPSIATVSNGVLTAKSAGETILTVKTEEAEYWDTCIVSVGEGTDTTEGMNYIQNADGSVTLTGVGSASVSKLKIPDTVFIDGVEHPVTSIGASAFKGNSKIKKITGGANLTKISSSAFKNCKKLKTIDLHSARITLIGSNAFNGCVKVTSLKINGNKLTSIGKNAFKNVGQKARITVYIKSKAKYEKLVNKIKSKGAKTQTFKFKKKKS
ncbi:leucine-rich repeat protein [Butyrivibrio sp. NC2002]|uniref:leucine-rich repeat protein n=1 Tax=Butyrivibrio sp. NC2002 TaxID=1410610 RepID=UPI0005697EBF|nr:leucine-rich repeat protein [Butyrivibrio sp. NC2002]